MTSTLIWTAFCVLVAFMVLALLVRGFTGLLHGKEPRGPYRGVRRQHE